MTDMGHATSPVPIPTYALYDDVMQLIRWQTTTTVHGDQTSQQLASKS